MKTICDLITKKYYITMQDYQKRIYKTTHVVCIWPHRKVLKILSQIHCNIRYWRWTENVKVFVSIHHQNERVPERKYIRQLMEQVGAVYYTSNCVIWISVLRHWNLTWTLGFILLEPWFENINLIEIDKQIYIFGMDQIECNLGKRQIIGQNFFKCSLSFYFLFKNKTRKTEGKHNQIFWMYWFILTDIETWRFFNRFLS